MSVEQRIAEMYNDYEVKPYISPERDLATWLLEAKPVPKRNMVRLEEGLLPGDIIYYGALTLERLKQPPLIQSILSISMVSMVQNIWNN